MDNEESKIIDHSKLKILFVFFVAILLIVSVLSFFHKKSLSTSIVNLPQKEKEETEAMKQLKLQVENLDKVRAEYKAHNTSTVINPKDQIKDLDKLKNNISKVPTTSNKTKENQMKDLDTLRSSLKK